MRNIRKLSKFSDSDILDNLESDCERIVSVFYKNGFNISKVEAKAMWDAWTDLHKSPALSKPLPKTDTALFSQFEKLLLKA